MECEKLMEFLEILKKLHKNPQIVNKLFGKEYIKKQESKEFGILAAAKILEQSINRGSVEEPTKVAGF